MMAILPRVERVIASFALDMVVRCYSLLVGGAEEVEECGDRTYEFSFN